MTDEATASAAPATEGTVETAAESIRKQIEAKASPPPDNSTPKAQSAEEPAATLDDEMPPETGDAVEEQPDAVEDTGQEPTIEPPAGWTAEDKEWFKTLDPARQDSILRQYKGSQAAEARRQNEYAEQMKQLQAEHQAAAQARQNLESALREYANPLMREFQQQFADVLRGQIDPVQLSRTDPARYLQFQAYQDKFRQIEETQARIQQENARAEETQLAQFRQTENEKLFDLIPELKNPQAFQKWDADVSQYLLNAGVPAENIMRASADQLAIAHKAMLWDRAKAAQASKPPPQQSKPAPKMLKPSNGNQGNGATEGYSAALKQARRSGSTEDAAALIRMKMQNMRDARR